MGFINLSEKTINAKLVYYGVGLGGKTTSLKVVHGMLCPNDEVKLVSINTEQDSTLLFDFLPIDLGTVEGFKIRVQGFTVPGQPKYVVMRKYVLQGADAVVLVVDSRKRFIEDNLQSIEDLKTNLEANGLDWRTIPLVIQYNKRDLPDLIDRDELDHLFRFRDVPVFETIAPDGVGVYEAFTEVVGWMVEEKVRHYGLGRGRVEPEVVGRESRTKLEVAREAAPDGHKVGEGLVSLSVPECPEALRAMPGISEEDAKTGLVTDDVDGPCRFVDDSASLPLCELFETGTQQGEAITLDALDGEAFSDIETTTIDAADFDAADFDAGERVLAASERKGAASTLEVADDLLGQAIHSNLELAELYSELAEYKSRLEKKNRELVEANQLIAHDLKKPLTVFKNVLHLLQKELIGPLTDKQRDAVENCTESVSYMEELVADILDSSRLDYDGMEFAFEDVDLTMVVGGIVRRLRYDLEKTGVRMRVEPLPVVQGDRAGITKVFANLLGNAIHYRDATKDVCEVHVRSIETDDAWWIEVEDNGIGIPEDCRMSIFDKFARGVNTATLSGTGLGLYIVQQMARGHGGDVRVESEVGTGTKFVIELPKVPEQATHSPVA
ncbi:MAG: hypothetical protein H6832_14405 [Planctomycetes bacterium]|nr:hypothetical protein [Planctomycetota bacterium]MCB9919591.1 hypothetical protein [Planctomycetota bacterium]